MDHTIKKAADLDILFGKRLAKTIKTFGGGLRKRLPSSVYIMRQKPAFHLDDGGTLKAYGVNLATGELTGERYLGSADTSINHLAGQFSEGHRAPEGFAMLFVETFYNGRNHSWVLTVVTDDTALQLNDEAVYALI